MKTTNQRVHLSIGFGDAILPIIESEDGQQRVPFLPIINQIEKECEDQRRRIHPDTTMEKRLGLVDLALNEGDKPITYIRLDRVEAFLNGINPQYLRDSGNHLGAEWLEERQKEWDDAIHEFVNSGYAINKSFFAKQELKDKGFLRLGVMIREKNRTKDKADVLLLNQMIKEMSNSYGLDYQSELSETA